MSVASETDVILVLPGGKANRDFVQLDDLLLFESRVSRTKNHGKGGGKDHLKA
jgi:hypothetical protein